MDDITDLATLAGGKSLTTSSTKNGVALLGDVIGKYIAPVQIAHDYRARWEATVCPIGVGRAQCEIEQGLSPARLAGAKSIHAPWLRCYAQIEATHIALSQMLMGFDRVDPLTASRMVSVLFAALGKKKTDTENALLLAATVDMFSPLDESVAIATGLWEPLNQHPLIVALAIKALIAKSVFTSASELRAEMKRVVNAIGRAAWAMEYIATTIWEADEAVFLGDRAAWDAHYASVGADVAAVMRDNLVEEDAYTDDDDNEIAASPRWLALDALASNSKGETP